MQFLILSHHAGSKDHGMVYRNYAWAKSLVDMGHNVTIVASSFSHVRTKQPKSSGYWETEKIDGINYIWLKGFSYQQSDRWLRLFSILKFMILLFFYQRKIIKNNPCPYDCVIASSPHPFVIFPAWKIAKKINAKLVFDIRDLWPLSLIELGNYSRKNLFIRLVQYAEDYACRKSDLVTAVPHNAENYLKQHGLSDGKFIAINNGFLHDDIHNDENENLAFPLPENHQSYIEAARKEQKLIIGYAGALGLANGMHYFIEAMAKLPQGKVFDDIVCLFIGKGEHVDRLQQLIIKNNLQKKIILLPPISKEQVKTFLQQIDIAYLGFESLPLYDHGVSPTKLADYMMAKKPVLYSINDKNNPIAQSEGGICCKAADPESIAVAISDFVTLSKEQRLEMGDKAYQWALENFSVKKHMERLIKKIESAP